MLSDVLTVDPVASSIDEKAFRAFPYRLYSKDRNWVAPLEAQERRRWLVRHNSSLRLRWTVRFLARRGRNVVGRVAAIVDDAFADRWCEASGFFGFFECLPDIEACRLLLQRSEAILQERGVRRVFGPVNLTTHDEVGILVAGFDRRPTLLSPYNPPYYEELLQGSGYVPRVDYCAFQWLPDVPESHAVGRIARNAERFRRSGRGITLRSPDPNRWKAENRVLFDLYNASFQGLWGFVPMTWEEYMERAEIFRSFYRPELVLIAEVAGQPAGFILALPDVNEALHGIRGRMWPTGWFRLAVGIPRIRTVRVILLGVLPQFHGRGIAPLLASRLAEVGRRRVRSAEISLVQASNRRMNHVIDAFGCVPVRRFRLYEKPLDGVA